MGGPTQFFCTFSETLTDVANALVDTDLLVPSYGAISDIPETGLVPPHTPESLLHIYYFMDDVISAVQGVQDCQHQVFDGTVRALKWLFLSLPGELKDSVNLKNLVAKKGDWTCVKEVLWWILDIEAEAVTLLERNFEELPTAVDIPTTQGRMVRRELEHLVGKLCSMYRAVPGAVTHLFHIQRALHQGGVGAWISPAFHRELADWKTLGI